MKELEEKRERFDAFFDKIFVDNSLEISKTHDTVSNIFREKEKK